MSARATILYSNELISYTFKIIAVSPREEIS